MTSNLRSRLSERTFSHDSYHPDVRDWVSELADLFGPALDSEGAFHQLLAIFRHARDFEILRRTSKANIRICFGADFDDGQDRCGMAVEGSSMRTVSPKMVTERAKSEPTVELIVSPSLVRWGNNSGTNYDRMTCLVKMDVVFSQEGDDDGAVLGEQSQQAEYSDIEDIQSNPQSTSPGAAPRAA